MSCKWRPEWKNRDMTHLHHHNARKLMGNKCCGPPCQLNVLRGETETQGNGRTGLALIWDRARASLLSVGRQNTQHATQTLGQWPARTDDSTRK